MKKRFIVTRNDRVRIYLRLQDVLAGAKDYPGARRDRRLIQRLFGTKSNDGTIELKTDTISVKVGYGFGQSQNLQGEDLLRKREEQQLYQRHINTQRILLIEQLLNRKRYKDYVLCNLANEDYTKDESKTLFVWNILHRRVAIHKTIHNDFEINIHQSGSGYDNQTIYIYTEDKDFLFVPHAIYKQMGRLTNKEWRQLEEAYDIIKYGTGGSDA